MQAFRDKRLIAVGALFVAVVAAMWHFSRPIVPEEAPRDTAGDGTGSSHTVARAHIAELVKSAELDPVKQKKIWDAEHITFLIETHLCKPLAAELHCKQWQRFPGWFREDFEGSVPKAGLREDRRQGIVRERKIPAGGETRPVDSAALGDWLMAGLKDFETVERARLRILKIDSSDAAETVWTTHMLFAAVGVKADGGPIQIVSYHDVDFEVADREAFKDEIQTKPVIRRWAALSGKQREADHALLEEATEAFGLADVPLPDNWKLPSADVHQYRFKLAVADYDRDGFLDIAAAPDTLEPLLLRSVEGKRFEFVADRMNLKLFRYEEDNFMSLIAAWIDFNNDAYPDLIMGNRLYRNESGTNFTDVTEASGLKIRRDPNGCLVADYDCDGLLDIYVLNQVPEEENRDVNMPWVGDNQHGAENQLWRNLGDGRFEDVTAKAGVGGGRRESFAAAWLFHDDDRFPDLYVANDFGENVLLRNRGDGTFEDITLASGAGDYATSMGVASGDLDNDGRPDIYVANMYSKMGRRIIAHVDEKDYPEGIYEQIKGSCAGNRLYLASSGQGKPYREAGEEMGVDAVGWAYAPTMADLDNDGFLDLYATTGFLSFDRHKPDG